MKSKLILVVMLMFLGIFSSRAQGFQRRTVEERTKMAIDRLVDSVKISDVQQKDITAVFTDYYKAQDKIREGLAPGARPERADMEKIMLERDTKLKIILTEDQYNRFKEMESAMRNRSQRPQ